MPLSERQRGIAIACAGVLCVTPDAVLLRWAQHLGASTAAILFWKYAFFAVWGGSWAVYEEWRDAARPSPASLYRRCRSGPAHFCAIVVLQMAATLTITVAFLTTLAANVMVFYALNVLYSALLGWYWLGDALPARTVAACAFAMACVGLVLFGAKLGGGGHGGGQASSLGDGLAFCCGVALSLMILATRSAAKVAPAVSVPAAAALAAVFNAALVWASTVLTGDVILPSAGPLFYGVMALDALCIACILMALAVAPRYITSAECGLACLLEVPLGPLWVFLVFGEQPGVYTLVGGTALLAGLALHEYAAARDSRSLAPADAKEAPGAAGDPC